MTAWTVRVSDDRCPADIDERLDDILDVLEPYGASMTINPKRVTVTMTIEANDPAFARKEARRLVSTVIFRDSD